MNKTISINIGGFVFNIEEDAYQKLFHYLTTIKKNFTEAEEREEIMNDIEARIAEIFQSKLSVAKEVILEKDVDQVIEIMGKPEEYVSEEFAGSADQKSSEKEKTSEDRSSSRRLFRDSENATLGGVCSGIAHYLNIDVSVIRILFVAFTLLGGSGILIYLIMLFAVPEAKTTNDKLQMKGQSINIDSIKEHFNKIKDDISEKTKNGKFTKTFNKTVEQGVRAGSNILRVVAKIMGLIFVVGGIFALIILFFVLFSHSGLMPIVDSEYSENLQTLLSILYSSETQSSIVFLSILFVCLIPIIGIIVTGTKVLFNIKKSFRTVSISSIVLWFICVGLLVVTSIDLGMNMRSEMSIEYPVDFTDSTDVLMIDVSEDSKFSDHISYGDVWNRSELIRIEEEKILLGYPELIIVHKAEIEIFEIIVYKESHGMSNKDAIDKAQRISYKINLSGNRLTLPPYFSIPKSDKIRGQRPIVEIRVPEGKQVILGKNIDRIDVHIHGQQQYENENFSLTTWTALGDRLFCEECKKNSDLIFSEELK